MRTSSNVSRSGVTRSGVALLCSSRYFLVASMPIFEHQANSVKPSSCPRSFASYRSRAAGRCEKMRSDRALPFRFVIVSQKSISAQCRCQGKGIVISWQLVGTVIPAACYCPGSHARRGCWYSFPSCHRLAYTPAFASPGLHTRRIHWLML